MRRTPFDDVEDNFDSCIHGVIPVGMVCSGCEREEWAGTCPDCSEGNADRLSNDRYACTNPDCIKDTGGMVWYVEGDHKIKFEPAEVK